MILKVCFIGMTVFPFLVSLGCSTPSVLIHKGDEAFEDSQDRLLRTMNKVEEIKAPQPEKAMFIQAESFYRYRFQPPLKGMTSYLAEAAATIMDFPAFQALAGALDVGDLRLRSTDGAVQLWETLLLRYPRSELRPFVLYRLGWAYRNIGITGLPRTSPEAFEELIHDYPESRLAALGKVARETSWKSKDIAASRSVIPGLGQLYVGETKNGVVRISIATAAATAILIPTYIASQHKTSLNWKKDWSLLASGLIGLITLSWDFTSSFEDAMRAVVDFNEREEIIFNKAFPLAP